MINNDHLEVFVKLTQIAHEECVISLLQVSISYDSFIYVLTKYKYIYLEHERDIYHYQ